MRIGSAIVVHLSHATEQRQGRVHLILYAHAWLQDDIRQLMRNDPRFFTRLIAQLDKQMHNMMRENQMRQKQMEADKKEIAQIDHTLKIHVYNNMVGAECLTQGREQ